MLKFINKRMRAAMAEVAAAAKKATGRPID